MSMETIERIARPMHAEEPQVAGHSSAMPQTVLSMCRCTNTISPDRRRVLISQLAYCFAERRGFVPGGELQDWLRAEAEVDSWSECEHYSGD